MRKKVLLFALMLCVFLQLKTQTDSIAYNRLFAEAENLFNGSANDHTDSLALNDYKVIISHTKLSASNAFLLYNCYERSGILLQGLSDNPQPELQNFYAAISIYHSYHLNDSVIFRLLLSIGNSHYKNSLFDSSVFYFKWAEKIIQQYPAAGRAEDLYNSLGALYNESGNYTESINYFSKALEIVRKIRRDYKEADFAMSMNIGSSLMSLGYFDSAAALYKSLLPVAPASAVLLNNLGRVYLSEKKPDSALLFLQKIKTADGNNNIAYNNSLGFAFMQKNDAAAAHKYLDAARDYYTAHDKNEKNNYYGLTCKYYGDLLASENKLEEALTNYQEAIIQLSLKFNNRNIYTNPENFIGDFTSYNLLKALLSKAECFQQLHKKDNSSQSFNGSFQTYQAAFNLSNYIKKSVATDEARLFIADNVLPDYGKCIDLILENNSGEKKYSFNTVLQLISNSRATSLAIGLKENLIKQNLIPDSLLQKERNTELNISRIKLQLQNEEDSAERSSLISLLNSSEIKLSQILESYQLYPQYYKQKFLEDTFNVTAVQKIINRKTAVICYYKGEKYLRAFLIKSNSVVLFNLPYNALLDTTVSNYISVLEAPENGLVINRNNARILFNSLFQPFEKDLDDIKSLVIIPDQELINLPFESFIASNGKYLVEQYDVTYQYALSFLQSNDKSRSGKALAMAPYNLQTKKINSFASLPYSAAEISSFSNNAIFLDTAATRQRFLQQAPVSSGIHLATHASVNYTSPENSFIAFYPVNKNDSSYKIYAHEIYSMPLHKTDFVFLSACETGTGKVSRSEGSLSLSRAFAYAGCSNIITSLWKAEDKPTAYLSEKFYYYISRNYSYAKALQQAKIDLLKDPLMSQFHSPQYWSHLIFTGNIPVENSYIIPSLIPLSIVSAIIIFIVFRSFKKRSY